MSNNDAFTEYNESHSVINAVSTAPWPVLWRSYAILLVMIWCVIMSGIPGASAETKHLIVAVYPNAPIIFPDQKESAIGIVPEILADMGRRNEWQITYLPGTWQESLERLARKEVDLLPAIAVSEARAKNYDFNTEPLLMNWGQIYTAQGVELDTLLDLSEKRLAVVSGDIYYERIKLFEHLVGIRLRFVEMDSYAAVFEHVQAERSDAGIVPRIFGAYNKGKYNVRSSPVNFFPVPLHFAVPKGDHSELIREIDRELIALKSNRNSVYHRSVAYWTEGVRTVAFPVWLKPWWIFASVTVFVILILSVNFILRRRIRQRTKQLKASIAAAEKVESELRMARGIQMDLVPKFFPKHPLFDLHAVLQPAKQVGGDFYDFFLPDEDHLFVSIGDVSDKGFPAALFMARVHTLLSAAGRTFATPEEMVAVVNRAICLNNDSYMFATVFLGILTLSTGDFVFVNAGHNPPLILTSQQGAIALAGARNTALGIDPDARFCQSYTHLAPGCRLILYTDGVTEAFCEEQRFFSEDRLMQTVARQKRLPAAGLVSKILADVKAFADGYAQTDDIAVMVVDYRHKIRKP